MPSETDTATAETTTETVNGSQAGEQTAASETTQEPTVSDPREAELERMRTELNKAKMHANHLENKRKEEERKRLEEANEYKTLYEQTLAEREAEKAERAEAERVEQVKRLRDSVIDSYDNEKVRDFAKTLVEDDPTALFWNDEAADESTAKAQVKAKLDRMTENLGLKTNENTTEETPIAPISGNNPLPPSNAPAGKPDMEALKERLKGVIF